MVEKSVNPEPEELEEVEKDVVYNKLSELTTELNAVIGDRKKRRRKVAELEEFLAKLNVKDFPELAESPVIQMFARLMKTDDLLPGQVANRGTLAEREREWTWRDLEGMEKVRFTPNETIAVTFQGIRVQLFEDEEIELPKPFYDIYQEHRNALRQARQNEAWIMGQSDTPPHPNWQTEEGARVRAWSTMGRAYGIRGGTIATGRIREATEEVTEGA